jgi:hypothetical protein
VFIARYREAANKATSDSRSLLNSYRFEFNSRLLRGAMVTPLPAPSVAFVRIGIQGLFRKQRWNVHASLQ